MQWDGRKKRRFRETLCQVERDVRRLKIFVVDYDFGRCLAEIPTETLEGMVFELIEWGERQGCLNELFAAFCEENAGNPIVENLKAELRVSDLDYQDKEDDKSQQKSILMVAANPKDTKPLRLQEEEREIKERLRLAGYGKVPIYSTVATRPRDIQQAILDFQPQIVHFSGHGTTKEGLAFENANGEMQFINPKALEELFQLFSEEIGIECVVLNACYSQYQAAIIAQHIDYVIGMKESIGDRSAIEFSVGFYTAIGSGKSIEFAYKLGCNAIQLEGIAENSVPVLFKKGEYTTFEFETASLKIVGNNPQIRRYRQQTWGFREPLGNNIELEMVYIPSGTFLMGAPESEEGSRDDERPQHQVSVPAFFLGKYPVTQAQWRAVANLPKYKRDLKPNPSCFSGDNRPVESVSWWDAVEFCQRLSQHTGREYRLPSEAEWEYACRAGTQTPFYFGETITTDLANYDGRKIYGRGKEGEFREKTTDVGSFPANGFGLFDMHGNVWEWCADDWHENYEGAPTDGSAWIDNEDRTGTRKLLRGGSWGNFPHVCRSAFRDGGQPDFTVRVNGFRVACASARTL